MLCCIISYGIGQASHKISSNSIKKNTSDSTSSIYNLSLTKIAVPLTLIWTSALFVENHFLSKPKENFQRTFSSRKHKVTIDNYMQFAPIVAVYGLNLCGVKSKHRFGDRTLLLAISYATMGAFATGMKYAFKEKRPDSDKRNSFPSGHTATAFMGAMFLYKEYKDVSPWIGYAGFAVAATTGYLRIYNNRHYINDVVAGACIGILSVEFAYWLYPKCFKRLYQQSQLRQKRLSVATVPYFSTNNVGVNVGITF